MDPEWHRALQLFCTWMTAGGASAGTLKVRRSYILGLGRKARISPWEVTSTQILDWIGASGWGAEAKKSARASTRLFYQWALGEGLVSKNPAANLPRITVPRGKPRPTPDSIITSALDRADRRERLMILLGTRAGLRRSEIAQVRGSDLQDSGLLHVVGKGKHERLVPVVDCELLTALRVAGDDYLFPGDYDGHISPDWAGKLLSRRLGSGWTAHTMRHRFGTRALAACKNLRTVQELLGHASPVTTAIYTAVVSDELFAAVTAAA